MYLPPPISWLLPVKSLRACPNGSLFVIGASSNTSALLFWITLQNVVPCLCYILQCPLHANLMEF